MAQLTELAQGSQPYPGMNPFGAENPKVHSKAATFRGRPHSPSKVGSPGERAALSGSRQHLRHLYTDTIAPSLRDQSQPRASHQREVVGWLNGVNLAPTHPNTGRHGADGIHDARHMTDNAPGQAHSASGGQYGKPQVRPAPDNGPRVRATRHAARGKLNDPSYTQPRKPRS